MRAPAVVDTKIGPGELIETDPDAQSIARLDIFISGRSGLGKGLGVGKEHSAQQPVRSDAEAVFRFEIQHVEAPVSSLDIATGGIAIRVPSGAWHEQIGRVTIARREPVIAPEGQYVMIGD